MREGDLGMMEEPTQDIVNIRVVSGDLKSQDKKMDESPKIDKGMNLSTEIERFQLEHSAFCRTKIINMDASSLLPTKRSPDLTMNREFPFAGGTHPPTSPRTSRNLYEIWKRYILLYFTQIYYITSSYHQYYHTTLYNRHTPDQPVQLRYFDDKHRRSQYPSKPR